MLFLVEDGVLHLRGGDIRLRPQEAKALEGLCLNKGHCLTKNEVAAFIWPAALPFCSDSLLKDIMNRLASRVITEHTRIEHRPGFGYVALGNIEMIHVQIVLRSPSQKAREWWRHDARYLAVM